MPLDDDPQTDAEQEKSAMFDAIFAVADHVETSTEEERVTQVRQALATACSLADRLQFPLAKLLFETKENRYWTQWGFGSFEEFVESECKFSLRKAQELMRVYRKLAIELKVSGERIRHLEWSKLALIAGQITEANLDQVLTDVEQKTFAELKQTYKPQHAKKQSDNFSVKLDRQHKFVLTPVVENALRCAERATGTSDMQVNLDAIAEFYLSNRSSPLNLRFGLN